MVCVLPDGSMARMWLPAGIEMAAPMSSALPTRMAAVVDSMM